MEEWERAVKLVRTVLEQANRMGMTAPVDDDFPRVKYEFDRAVLAYVKYLNEGRKVHG